MTKALVEGARTKFEGRRRYPPAAYKIPVSPSVQAALGRQITLCALEPIEPTKEPLSPSASAGSLGQDMAGRDTRDTPGSAGLSAAFPLSH